MFEKLKKPVPRWFAICLIAITLVCVSYASSITILKTIHGTASVHYIGDITITDFKFISSTKVEVTLETASPIACQITISGAGISGTVSVTPGEWSGTSLVKTITITGTLVEGEIVIEVT